jgi:ribonuclease HII
VQELSLFPEEPALPRSHYEKALRRQGYRVLAGTDEVGRGCLAGPVVAAAVILPEDFKIRGLTDSKLLTPEEREAFYLKIEKAALTWGVGIVEVEEIDRINIFHASLKAMAIAVQKLSQTPDLLLVDGNQRVPIVQRQMAVVKGDLYCKSISAASILAKVIRDRMMCEMEKAYPAFRFSAHKGYGTVQHRREIREHGPLPIHRKSFNLLGEKDQTNLFEGSEEEG